MTGSVDATARGSQVTQLSRSCFARACPSMAWRTGPPSRMSTTGIVASSASGSIRLLRPQDGLRALDDRAGNAGRVSDDLLHLLAGGGLEFQASLLDLGEHLRI